MSAIKLTMSKQEARIDSRIIAERLGIDHHNVIQTLEKYLADFEELAVVLFQTEKPRKGSKGGRPERFALLNEDQAYLLLTYSRNTKAVRRLKIGLVKAFSEMRESLAAKADYLPCYRECHDAISQLVKLSGSSVPESIHHMNVEKMINKAFGIPAGVRSELPPAVRSAVALAERIAGVEYQRAIGDGKSHRTAYRAAQGAVDNYAAKSAAEFGDSNQQSAHKRPNNLGAFFVPEYFMAVCAGRPSGLPVSDCTGSPTLRALPPLFGDFGGGLSKLQSEAVIMSTTPTPVTPKQFRLALVADFPISITYQTIVADSRREALSKANGTAVVISRRTMGGIH